MTQQQNNQPIDMGPADEVWEHYKKLDPSSMEAAVCWVANVVRTEDTILINKMLDTLHKFSEEAIVLEQVREITDQ